MNVLRPARFRKRHAVALIAIVTEVVLGLAWWSRRRRSGEDLSRDG
jgi:hypothetical protein